MAMALSRLASLIGRIRRALSQIRTEHIENGFESLQIGVIRCAEIFMTLEDVALLIRLVIPRHGNQACSELGETTCPRPLCWFNTTEMMKA